MTSPKLLHSVAIARKAAGLKQRQLAELLGCSLATIQSVEVGRMNLSRGLALRISTAIGADPEWLLKNDIAQKMPPLEPRPPVLNIDAKKEDATILILMALFARLLVIAGRQPKTYTKNRFYVWATYCLATVIQTEDDPRWEPYAETEGFQLLTAHPELLDPELRRLINLDELASTKNQRPYRAPEPETGRGFDFFSFAGKGTIAGSLKTEPKPAVSRARESA